MPVHVVSLPSSLMTLIKYGGLIHSYFIHDSIVNYNLLYNIISYLITDVFVRQAEMSHIRTLPFTDGNGDTYRAVHTQKTLYNTMILL